MVVVGGVAVFCSGVVVLSLCLCGCIFVVVLCRRVFLKSVAKKCWRR